MSSSMRQSSVTASDFKEALKADLRGSLADLPTGSTVPKSAVRIWARSFVRIMASADFSFLLPKC